MSRKNIDVSSSMLQPGRKAARVVDILPVSAEMPLVLTLDQFEPNPDNPRTIRNPRYDDIKASVRSRGLDTVPKVTRDPEADTNKYIFSDGGNTRYQILTELWRETGDERFYRIHVLYKPWPGRLQCVIGHLVENEMRGDLSFIEKASGIHKARVIYEEQLGKSVSIRELSMLLTDQGLPVDASSISRMESTLRYLYPWMPDLLESGLGRPQINVLLAIRQDAEKVWEQFCFLSDSSDKCFTDVFGKCCQKFNSPDLWSSEMFRDELIGDLLLALPHPDLNYDRWMMELDPKERNRRYHFGEPEILPASQTLPDDTQNQDREEQQINDSIPAPADNKLSVLPVLQETLPDMYDSSGSVAISGDTSGDTNTSSAQDFDNDDSNETLMSLLSPCQDEDEDNRDQDDVFIPDTSDDLIWLIPAYQDDIEHLQNMAFLIAWELAEQLGCKNEILPDRENVLSPGYKAADDKSCSASVGFLLFLAGSCPAHCPVSGLDILLIGGSSDQNVAILNDENAIKLLRLMRIVRRLRELQRSVIFTQEDADE